MADNEDRANEAEHFKNEQLRKQKEGKGEWHEEIASDSESMVGLGRISSSSISNKVWSRRSRQIVGISMQQTRQ
jgi:hypothetical protein